jgi:putative Holliday junction resolvase
MTGGKPESVLALDFGEKRVGLATANVIVRFASPLTTLTNNDQLFGNIEAVIKAENIIHLVVGYPRNMNGDATKQTGLAEEFAEKLRAEFALPVDLQDESLTSVKAEEELKDRSYSKAEVDALAASYILEDWLVQHAKIGKF